VVALASLILLKLRTKEYPLEFVYVAILVLEKSVASELTLREILLNNFFLRGKATITNGIYQLIGLLKNHEPN
jgi:hypothetical protein